MLQREGRSRRNLLRGVAALGLLGVRAERAAAQGVSAAPPGASTADAELLRVRRGVWEAWFSADRAALMEILPANFIGIGAGEPEMHTREQTIASAEGFLRAGNRLKDLRLFDDRVQRFGPVAVIYCRFSFTFTDPSGASTTVAGRATEVFLREGNRWIHPGWHLDSGA